MFEKESEEYFKNLDKCKTKEMMIDAYVTGAESREKQIDCLTLACENYREEMEKNLADAVKLEKENAELKERNRELLESCEGATMMYKDLCKAKEIIKTFLGFAEAFGYSPSMDNFISDTKQFLSEVEK